MRVAVGIDLGSTNVKVSITTPEGDPLASASTPTPWTRLPDGGAEMLAASLVGAVVEVLSRCLARLARAAGQVQVIGVGVSGMAESGTLLDSTGRAVSPVIAWWDSRGADAMAAAPADFRAELPRRTGLPATALASLAKLLHLRAEGLDPAALRWLNLPELVVHALGGEQVTEVSLASRTGFLDQDRVAWWPEALAVLGVDGGFLPSLTAAGQPCGRTAGRAALGPRCWPLPDAVSGAVLTVAGHDHLVAAAGAGAVSAGQLHVSMGTAEALVRVLDQPLPADARARLTRHRITALRYVLPDCGVLTGGTRIGLRLRRVLEQVGVVDDVGRAALDRAVLELPIGGGAAPPATPAAMFAATLEHGTGQLLELAAEIEAEVGPATRTVMSGGWTGMACVRRARSVVLSELTFAPAGRDSAFGAAGFAAYAAHLVATGPTDAATFLTSFSR